MVYAGEPDITWGSDITSRKITKDPIVRKAITKDSSLSGVDQRRYKDRENSSKMNLLIKREIDPNVPIERKSFHDSKGYLRSFVCYKDEEMILPSVLLSKVKSQVADNDRESSDDEIKHSSLKLKLSLFSAIAYEKAST